MAVAWLTAAAADRLRPSAWFLRRFDVVFASIPPIDTSSGFRDETPSPYALFVCRLIVKGMFVLSFCCCKGFAAGG
jgi:hypothetical protein